MADMTPEDARAILGLTALSTAQCIRRARRKLVRAHHPDLVPRHSRALSDRKLAEINAAFDLLIALHGTRANPWPMPQDMSKPSGPKPASQSTAKQKPHAKPQRSAQPSTAAEDCKSAQAKAAQAPNQPTRPPKHPPTATTTHLPLPAAPRYSGPERRALRAFQTGLHAVSRDPDLSTRTEYA